MVAAGMVRTHAGGANDALERFALSLFCFYPMYKVFAELFSKSDPFSYTNAYHSL